MNSILVAIGIVVGLFLLNVYLFKANRNTPAPEDCENLVPDCAGCKIMDCIQRRESKGEKND